MYFLNRRFQIKIANLLICTFKIKKLIVICTLYIMKRKTKGLLHSSLVEFYFLNIQQTIKANKIIISSFPINFENSKTCIDLITK